MDHAKYMRMAIEKTKHGIGAGQSPFGCCIVKNDQIVSCEHNVVWATTDITAHAEVNAIRVACRQLRTIDLSGCVLYTTCEPCPMCFSAAHWARVTTIVYGASIADALQAGFHELTLSCQMMKTLGNSEVEIHKDMLKEECVTLFDMWKKARGRVY